jgi:hypothetical protein
LDWKGYAWIGMGMLGLERLLLGQEKNILDLKKKPFYLIIPISSLFC